MKFLRHLSVLILAILLCPLATFGQNYSAQGYHNVYPQPVYQHVYPTPACTPTPIVVHQPHHGPISICECGHRPSDCTCGHGHIHGHGHNACGCGNTHCKGDCDCKYLDCKIHLPNCKTCRPTCKTPIDCKIVGKIPKVIIEKNCLQKITDFQYIVDVPQVECVTEYCEEIGKKQIQCLPGCCFSVCVPIAKCITETVECKIGRTTHESGTLGTHSPWQQSLRRLRHQRQRCQLKFPRGRHARKMVDPSLRICRKRTSQVPKFSAGRRATHGQFS